MPSIGHLRKHFDEKFLHVVKEIGMNLETDEEYLWIAEKALNCPLGDEWKEFDADGEPAYYHPRLKILQTTNPVLDKFKEMFENQKSYTSAMTHGPAPKTNVSTRLSVILNECLNRCHRSLPPVTPELVEKTCILLGINTGKQHLLARTVKLQLDEFVEEQYELATAVGQVVDSQDFLDRIHQAQVEMDVIRKPDEVVMCTEIPGKPAAVKCEQCKDFFSLEGFKLTHATGKRRGHSTLLVDQKVCSVYQSRLATCEVGGTMYCDDAYEEKTAEDPELCKQPKKVLGGLQCSEYPKGVAEVVCEECVDLFCWEAFLKLHRKGKRRSHLPLVFDQEGHLWRGGVCLPPEESQALIDRCRLIAEGGPWCAFRDDNFNTYWYHWEDKATTLSSPFIPTGPGARAIAKNQVI